MNNLKGTKQKPANSQTPKKPETSLELDRYFSRPNSIRNYPLKENMNPNINYEKQRKKQKQKDCSNNASPKKKVIHLKSICKNSKSVKDKGSGSVDRNLKSEQNCTQVGDFSDKYEEGISPIKIDVDLKSHRKSMQDTLVSSNQLYEKVNRPNIPNCDQHLQKAATFIIKGRPFCDKCSVKYITKGYVGVKIRNEMGCDIYQQVAERSGKKQTKIKKEKQNRNIELRQFIGKVDKAEQLFDQLIFNIEQINRSISKQMQQELDKFWDAWKMLMEFLDKFKANFLSKFKRMEQKLYEQLTSVDAHLQEKVSSLKFMRNDIVRNVDKIIESQAVPDSEYRAVMLNFEEQLRIMEKQSQDIKKNIFLLPKIQFGLYKIEDSINGSIHIVSTAEQLMRFQFGKSSENQNSQAQMQGYRISFGRQIQKLSSPTFKIF